MSEVNILTDQENFGENPSKPSSLLNVLTILTFIACGIGAIFSFLGFLHAQANYDRVAAMNLDQLPSFAKKIMGADPLGDSLRMLENKLPIFLLTVVSLALCLYGALQMRRLKKVGFYIYLLGELVVPLITAGIFMSVSAMGGFVAIIAYVFEVVFISLYATQLKYMH